MPSFQEQLVFVVSPPRSGSTLLQRMLGSHSQIFTHPEPHLITPLAYLGFHDTVDKAPYDHINSAEAIRLFVDGLPNKEGDYLDALRAYADTMYSRMLATSDRSRFLDKTPAYALVLPFLTKLYPRAKYVVLTRHPLAVFSSYANSFFEGDWETARAFNPIVERYVPAVAKFLRTTSVPHVHVRYEDLVERPEVELARMFELIGVENEPRAVEYGKHFDAKKGPGDPISVSKHDRPVADSVEKWAVELKGDARKMRIAESMLASLSDEDLASWGNPRDTLLAALDRATQEQAQPRAVNAYTMKRKVLLALKRDIHDRPHGKLLRRVRYYCDVLLRE